MHARSKRRLVAVIALLGALVVVEIGLRTIGGVFGDRFTQPDMNRGWSLKPGFGGWIKDENTFWMTINSRGLRDVEHAVVKPAGSHRVAVLGDSYMQGTNVPLEKTFSRFLQGELDRCAAPARPEVINFGVSGYGTAQELITFEVDASRYSPDVVLLAFYTGNDVHNNARRTNPSEFPELTPYFTLDGNGALQLDASFRSELAASEIQPGYRRARMWLTDRLRIAQLLYENYGAVRERFRPEAAPSSSEPREGLRDLIYRPPEMVEMRDAWRVTEALLLKLDSEVRASGAQFWIVTLANEAQLEPDRAQRRKFAETLGNGTLTYPDDRLRRFGAEHGIPVITLVDRMAAYTSEHGVALNGGYNANFPLGSGHWNEQGYGLAAQLTAHDLCERGALALR